MNDSSKSPSDLEIDRVIAVARRDSRCVTGSETRALCEEIERLRREMEKMRLKSRQLESGGPVMTEDRKTSDAEALAWIRRKLELPEDAQMFTGTNTIAGALHVVCDHAHGYRTYVEAFRCNDKQGEIARLAVKVAQLQADNARLTEELQLSKKGESDQVNHWRIKAQCYGNIVRGCTPALEASGFPVDCTRADGAVGGIARAVLAMHAAMTQLRQEKGRLEASLSEHGESTDARCDECQKSTGKDWRIGLSVKPKYRPEAGVVLDVLPSGTAGIVDETGVLKIRLISGTVILRGADDWVTA